MMRVFAERGPSGEYLRMTVNNGESVRRVARRTGLKANEVRRRINAVNARMNAATARFNERFGNQ